MKNENGVKYNNVTSLTDRLSLRDTELLKRIAIHRDKQALNTLYTLYSHKLSSFLYRRLHSTRLVDEIYNEVMFTVWCKANQYRGQSRVSTWIFGIAYHLSLAQLRKDSRRDNRLAQFPIDELPDQASEEFDHLYIAISKLSFDHRTVIELAYFYGYSIAEIAEIIDCPQNTVKTRLHYSRRHLKNLLQQLDNEYEA